MGLFGQIIDEPDTIPLLNHQLRSKTTIIDSTMEISQPRESMYHTTNSAYGMAWQTADPFQKSFTQTPHFKALTNHRAVTDKQLPKNNKSAALVHNPEHPCGIMSMSNVPVTSRGDFTNVRRDFFSDHQGLWSNCAYNTREATIDLPGSKTYSNLQGGWGRIGPSTYDATHANGTWANKWNTIEYAPAVQRSMYDHRNVDPRDNFVPMEMHPQNM